jgi:hypothetical protein
MKREGPFARGVVTAAGRLNPVHGIDKAYLYRVRKRLLFPENPTFEECLGHLKNGMFCGCSGGLIFL